MRHVQPFAAIQKHWKSHIYFSGNDYYKNNISKEKE